MTYFMQQKRSKPVVKSSADAAREVTCRNFQQGPQLHRNSAKAAVAGYKILHVARARKKVVV